MHMVGHLNACVCVPERDPVDYAGRRMDDHPWELCKRRAGVRDDRAKYGGSICLWHRRVQVGQKGPMVGTRTRASRVLLATCGRVGLDDASV
jgi:hypothetical protein